MNEKKRGMLGQARTLIDQALGIVSHVRDLEEDSLENLSERFEGTDQYESMENAVDDMDDAMSDLESAKGNIDLACGR